MDITNLTALITQNSTMQTKGTAALLRSSTNHQDGWAAWIDGLLSAGDGQGGFYDYSASSTAADDGINVLKPNDVLTNGRWIKRL